MTSATCAGCGRQVEGGTAGCRADFDNLVGRDFGDARFFASHRLFVDVYALQHPDEFCRSAKSLAAHLVGLHLIVERGIGAATGAPALRGWLDGPGALTRPQVPADRGSVTLGDLIGIDHPARWREALLHWAEHTWEAWRELHPLARQWADEALASGRSGQRR
jgi:hypothetical protein